ncbi:DUF6164 family protein [Pseudoxanthomonas composti]|uniref:DUF2007 domain-containing protein n=1 Tax=Pseudoxanthomonas composti TaxID=2137479 RepID=A0A4Q1JX14_9GAMM|nr:DUF6164 family protein [Pseudoxanthomonas composti]RXR07191.1 hypothetical protein EPA99_04525 [Pseudoxanthomonas composti]
MPHLLLNLKLVPDDEAAEVRDLLSREGIAFYETRPSPWGISHGGIWLEDPAQIERAGALMAQYQQARRSGAQAERARAVEEGRQETFARQLRERPGYTLLMLLAMVVIIALTLALPWWLLR